MHEAAHEAGKGFHRGGEATNRGSTGFMDGFHLGGGKAGIGEVVLPNFLQNGSSSTKEAAPPEEPEPEPFLEEPDPCHVSNLPMGYPVLQQPIMPAPGQPHIDPMACGLSSGHVVNGIPAPGGYHPIRMNSGNDMAVDNGVTEAPHAGVTGSAMSSEMAVSPSSAASSNHAPFTPSEIPGMTMDVSALDSAFGSDVGNAGPLQLGPDGTSRDSIRSLGQLWNFSLSDLTADLTSLGDLEALENYTGTPFLTSDSDILLDSPDQDDIVEYFADAINGSQSDEEKP
ncbi:unnamed protein product [Urochloa decumbens]|uniref:Uncharacterized protein n=1 Tax=Urochloa decumbens TaxID=240449 RepID=A0ABC8Z0P4_9POAL